MRFQFIRPAAVCLVAAALVACGGAEERKAEHLKKAVQFFEQENLEKASVEFKNVLQIDPKTPKPYYYLGRIEEGKKNWREAFGFYQKAVELDPNDLDAQLKYAQFILLSGDVDKAASLTERLGKERPADLDVRMLQVAIASRKGQSDEALAGVEKIVAEKPSRPEPYIVLAALYGAKGKQTESEKALKDGLSAIPKNPELLNALIRLYAQQKQAGPAEQAIKELIDAQPTALQHRVVLAQLYIQLNRWAETEQTLRTAIKDFPQDPKPPVLLAEFFIKRGERDKAEAEIKAAIAANPSNVSLYQALAQLLEQTKRADQAEKTYRDFIEKAESKPDLVKAKDALAALLVRLNRSDESKVLLKEVLDENPQDHDALLLQGKLALANKNAQDAISAFRSLLKDQPDSTEALTLLAGAYSLDGKPALAQENLEKAVSAKPEEFGLRKNLVEFLARQKNFTLATDKIDEFLKLNPKSLDAFNLKADVLAASGQAEALEKLLKEIKSGFPDNALGPMRLGGLYVNQKKFDAALGEYEEGLKRTKEDYEPLKAIVGIYLQLKQPEKAQARLKKALLENPKSAGVYQLMGALQTTQNHVDEAVKALNTAIELNPRWILPYMNVGQIYEAKGELEKTVQAYQRALQTFPADPNVRINLARVYEHAKDYPKAIEQYEAIIKAYPENLLTINNLASLLSLDASDKTRMDRAFELAKRLENSDQPVFVDTLAWIYYQRGEYDKALALELKVLEKQPDEPVFQYHLGMIYGKKGDVSKAKESLAKAVQTKGNYIGLEEAKEVLKSLETAK